MRNQKISKGRCLTVLLTVFFQLAAVFSEVPAAHAQALDAAPLQAAALASLPLDLPSQAGEFEKVYLPEKKSSLFVYIIQDAHSSGEAQDSILQILEYLDSRNRLDEVWVEGASGVLDAGAFRVSQSGAAEESFRKKLASKGLISGAEHYLLRHPEVKALGIESAEGYRRNLEAFRGVMEEQGRAAAFLDARQEELQQRVGTVLSPEGAAFLNEWKLLNAGPAGTGAKLTYLTSMASRSLGTEWQDFTLQTRWPNILRFLELQKLGENFHSAEVKKEFKRFQKTFGRIQPGFLEEIHFWLEFPAKEAAIDRSAAFRLRHLLETMSKELKPAGFSFKKFPALSAHLAALTLQNEMDAPGLFREIRQLEDDLFLFFGQTKEGISLLQTIRDAELLKKGSLLELTRDEVPAFDRAARELEASGNLPVDFKNWSREVLEFYNGAHQREDTFLSVLGEAEDSPGFSEPHRYAALIAGGFHRTGIEERLAERHVPFAVVRPRLSAESDETLYKRSLLGLYPETSQIPHARAVLMPASVSAQMMGRAALTRYGNAVARIWSQTRGPQAPGTADSAAVFRNVFGQDVWVPGLSPARSELRSERGGSQVTKEELYSGIQDRIQPYAAGYRTGSFEWAFMGHRIEIELNADQPPKVIRILLPYEQNEAGNFSTTQVKLTFIALEIFLFSESFAPALKRFVTGRESQAYAARLWETLRFVMRLKQEGFTAQLMSKLTKTPERGSPLLLARYLLLRIEKQERLEKSRKLEREALSQLIYSWADESLRKMDTSLSEMPPMEQLREGLVQSFESYRFELFKSYGMDEEYFQKYGYTAAETKEMTGVQKHDFELRRILAVIAAAAPSRGLPKNAAALPRFVSSSELTALLGEYKIPMELVDPALSLRYRAAKQKGERDLRKFKESTQDLRPRHNPVLDFVRKYQGLLLSAFLAAGLFLAGLYYYSRSAPPIVQPNPQAPVLPNAPVNPPVLAAPVPARKALPAPEAPVVLRDVYETAGAAVPLAPGAASGTGFEGETLIAARIDGTLNWKIKANAGDVIKQGTPIAEIQNKDWNQQTLTLQNQIEERQKTLDEKRGQLSVPAQTDLEREIHALKLQLERVEHLKKQTAVIRAPFDLVVRSRLSAEGSNVKAFDKLLEYDPLNRIWIQVPVDAAIPLQALSYSFLEAEVNEQKAQVLTRIMSLDPDKRTAYVKFELLLPSSVNNLREPVRYRIFFRRAGQMPSIPEGAVLWRTFARTGSRVRTEVQTPANGGSLVFSVTPDKKAPEGRMVNGESLLAVLSPFELIKDQLKRQKEFVGRIQKVHEGFPRNLKPAEFAQLDKSLQDEQAVLKKMEEELNHLEVRARDSGILTGSLPLSGQGVDARQKVFMISSPRVVIGGNDPGRLDSMLLVETSLVRKGKDAKAEPGKVGEGDPVIVRLPGGEVLMGKITSVAGAVQSPKDSLLSRMTSLTVEVDDPNHSLPEGFGSSQGMPVEIIFVASEFAQAYKIQAGEVRPAVDPGPFRAEGYYQATDRPLLVEAAFLAPSARGAEGPLMGLMNADQNPEQRLRAYKFYTTNLWDKQSLEGLGRILFGPQEDVGVEALREYHAETLRNKTHALALLDLLEEGTRLEKEAAAVLRNADEEARYRRISNRIYDYILETLEVWPEEGQDDVLTFLSQEAGRHPAQKARIERIIFGILKTESPSSPASSRILRGPFWANHEAILDYAERLEAGGEEKLAFLLRSEYMRRRSIDNIQAAHLGGFPGVIRSVVQNVRASSAELPFHFYEEDKKADEEYLRRSPGVYDKGWEKRVNPEYLAATARPAAGAAEPLSAEGFEGRHAASGRDPYFENLSDADQNARIQKDARERRYYDLAVLLETQAGNKKAAGIANALMQTSEGRLHLARVYVLSKSEAVLKAVESQGFESALLQDITRLAAQSSLEEAKAGKTPDRKHVQNHPEKIQIYEDVLLRLYSRAADPARKTIQLRVFLALIPSPFEVSNLAGPGARDDQRFQRLIKAVPKEVLLWAVEWESWRRHINTMLRQERKWLGWNQVGEFIPGLELRSYEAIRQTFDVETFTLVENRDIQQGATPIEVLRALRDNESTEAEAKGILKRLVEGAEIRNQNVRNQHRVKINIMGYLWGGAIFIAMLLFGIPLVRTALSWGKNFCDRLTVRFSLRHSAERSRVFVQEFDEELKNLRDTIKASENVAAFEGTDIHHYLESLVAILEKRNLDPADYQAALNRLEAIVTTKKIVYSPEWMRNISLFDLEGKGFVFQLITRAAVLMTKKTYSEASRRWQDLSADDRLEAYYRLGLFAEYARYASWIRNSFVPISNIKETMSYQVGRTNSWNPLVRAYNLFVRAAYYPIQIFLFYRQTWARGRSQHLDMLDREVLGRGNELHDGLYTEPKALVSSADENIKSNIGRPLQDNMELGFKPAQRARKFWSRFLTFFLPALPMWTGLALWGLSLFTGGYVEIGLVAIVAGFAGGPLLSIGIHVGSVMTGWNDPFHNRSIQILSELERSFAKDLMGIKESRHFISWRGRELKLSAAVVMMVRGVQGFINFIFFFFLPDIPDKPRPLFRLLGLDGVVNRTFQKWGLFRISRWRVDWVQERKRDLQNGFIQLQIRRNRQALEEEMRRDNRVPSADMIVIIDRSGEVNEAREKHLRKRLEEVVRPDVPVLFVHSTILGSGAGYLEAKKNIGEQYDEIQKQKKFAHLRGRKSEELRVVFVLAGGRGGVIAGLMEDSDLLIPLPGEDNEGRPQVTMHSIFGSLYAVTQKMEDERLYGEVLIHSDAVNLTPVQIGEGINLWSSRKSLRYIVDKQLGVVFGLHADEGSVTNFFEKASESELLELIGDNAPISRELDLGNRELSQYPAYTGFLAVAYGSSERYREFNERILEIERAVHSLAARGEGTSGKVTVDFGRDILVPLIRVSNSEDVANFWKARVAGIRDKAVRKFYQDLFTFYDDHAGEFSQVAFRVNSPHRAQHFFRDIRRFGSWSRVLRASALQPETETPAEPFLFKTSLDANSSVPEESVLYRVQGHLPDGLPSRLFLGQIPLKPGRISGTRWVTVFSGLDDDLLEENKIFGIPGEQFLQRFQDSEGQPLFEGFTDIRKAPLFTVSKSREVQLGFLRVLARMLAGVEEGNKIRINLKREDFIRDKISLIHLVQTVSAGGMDFEALENSVRSELRETDTLEQPPEPAAEQIPLS
ncbi:MAG: hypothetical protein FGM27_06400, partial [Candidatus Omnitrophica bacterium]|nr:hypothetical protein [Candidatus Omnitrophota bacterium]